VLRLILLEDVVLDGAAQPVRRDALLLRRNDVEAEQDDGRAIDGHGNGDVAERDAVEERLHVGQRADRHAALADLAQRTRVVRVVAHERREIEGDAEPRLAVGEEILVATVRFLGRAEAGELPHGPQPGPVHGRIRPARERVLAGQAELLEVVPAGLTVGRRVERTDGRPGNRRELRLPQRQPFERGLPGSEPGAQLGELALLRLDPLEQLGCHDARLRRIRPGHAHLKFPSRSGFQPRR
jgi:hypothetical protein